MILVDDKSHVRICCMQLLSTNKMFSFEKTIHEGCFFVFYL